MFGAKVYKIARDAQGVRLSYLKLTGGTLSVRDTLRYRGADGSVVEEKAAQLRLYSGRKFETAQTVSAGDVVAVVGLSETRPGQGLGAEPDADTPLLTPAMGYRIGLPAGIDAQSVLPKLRQMDRSLPEAAMDLGCTPVRAFFKATLPEIFPGILTGLLMAFTLSLDDFVISYFTTGNSFQTLPIRIYNMTKKTVTPKMYALATIIFFVILALLLISNLIDTDQDKTKT